MTMTTKRASAMLYFTFRQLSSTTDILFRSTISTLSLEMDHVTIERSAGSLDTDSSYYAMSLPPNKRNCCAFSSSPSLLASTCPAASFTWHILPAMQVMAILDRFDIVPDLTISCHWWSLICILRVGECCINSCMANGSTVERHATTMHSILAIRPCLGDEPHAAVVKASARSFIWTFPAAIGEKSSFIHFKDRCSYAT